MHDWKSIWLFPAGFAFAVLVCFGFAFRGQGKIGVQSVH
jgi:hypothetical protein